MRRLALLVCGLVVGVALLEIGLRIYWYPGEPDRWYDTASPVESMRWIPHPFLPYAGRPNAEFRVINDDGSREHIVTNSYGFRAHEFPPEKRPEDFFVICLGGSTTFGYKVDANANTWPERLEALLAERYPERNVRVFNFGVDMATSVVSLVNLALVGVHLEPDLVIVYHGYNEVAAYGTDAFRTDHAHFYRDLVGPPFSYQAWLPAPLRRSYALKMVTGIVDRRAGTNDLALAARRHPGTPTGDGLLGLEATLTNFRSMQALAESRGGTALFSTFQFRDGDEVPLYAAFNDALRRFFEESGFAWVDQDALLPDRDPSINVDPCHFTQKGREQMARNFYDHIVAAGLLE